MIPCAKYNDIGIKIIEVTVKKRVFQFFLAHPIYEEGGERHEGGTCSGRRLWGELGRAGGQAGMGRKVGREGKGGLEATVRKAVP